MTSPTPPDTTVCPSCGKSGLHTWPVYTLKQETGLLGGKKGFRAMIEVQWRCRQENCQASGTAKVYDKDLL